MDPSVRWLVENAIALWAVGALAAAAAKLAPFIERRVGGPSRRSAVAGVLDVIAWPLASLFVAAALVADLVAPRRRARRYAPDPAANSGARDIDTDPPGASTAVAVVPPDRGASLDEPADLKPGHPGLRIGGVVVLKPGEQVSRGVLRDRISRGVAAALGVELEEHVCEKGRIEITRSPRR